MVQVIEQGNFGGRLGESVGQLLQNHATMMQQRQQQKMLANLLNPQALSSAGRSSIPQQMNPDQEAQAYAAESQLVSPKFAEFRQEQRRQQNQKDQGIDSLKKMTKILDKNSTGRIKSHFGKENLRNNAAFDQLAFKLEQYAAERVGKGTLSQARFDFLKKLLPSSKKSQSRNYGDLQGWATELGVDPRELGIPTKFLVSELVDDKKQGSVQSNGKAPTADIVDKFLRKANGDPIKAREYAKKAGYKV